MSGIIGGMPLWVAYLDALEKGCIGTGVISGCDVTADGTAMAVSVAAGTVCVEWLNPYSVAAASLTIAAADATYIRYDAVVFDTSVPGLTVLTGTPSATPAPQKPSATQILLAVVKVSPGATVITADDVTDCRVKVPGKIFLTDLPLFGDGSDGDVTLSATTLDLSGQVKQYNNLTLTSSVIEATTKSWLWIFVKDTLTIDSASAIRANACGAPGGAGGAGAAGVGGAGSVGTAGVCSSGAAGTGGAAGAGGAAGTDYRAGGGGGNGETAGGGAGANGVSPENGDNFSLISTFVKEYICNLVQPTCGGSGGGGGGGDGTVPGGSGGAGGAAGGYVVIHAKKVVNNGVIAANGGAGAAGGNAGNIYWSGGGGGGGGGDGGVVIIVTREYTGTGSISVAGGAGGKGGVGGYNGSAGSSNGGAGAAGAAGKSFLIIVGN